MSLHTLEWKCEAKLMTLVRQLISSPAPSTLGLKHSSPAGSPGMTEASIFLRIKAFKTGESDSVSICDPWTTPEAQ